MNRDIINKVLLLGEGQNVEFKINARLDIIGREICALLNSGGGFVVCGVDNNGTIVGIEPETDVARLEQNLNESISPKALISVEPHEIESKTVLVFEVPAGKDIPYAYNNEIYIREDDNTRKANIDIIRDMVQRRQVEPERWERRFSIAEIDDLDTEEIRAVVKAVAKTTRIRFRDCDNPIMVLEDLSIL